MRRQVNSDVNAGDRSDAYIAVGIAVVIYAALIWFAFRYSGPVSSPLFVLSGLLGASLGWVAGILVSPYNPEEKTEFGEISKLIAGFLSGYVLSKFDPVITHALDIKEQVSVYWVVACVGLVSFLTAAAVTYITRRYWVMKKRVLREEAQK